MTTYGVDEDWNRLTPAQLLAAGKTFAAGYVSEDPTGKNITKAEVDAYLAAGVAVLLVYEYSITAIAGGAARGTRDAGIAINGARALGCPAGCAIAFAIDEDTSSNPPAVDAYARAFTAACHVAGYRSMVYGGLATVKRCLDLALVDLAWQTYAWSGSPTQWDPRAAIRQTQNAVTIAGKQVDLDVAMVADYGAWTGGTMTDPLHVSDPVYGVDIQNDYAADRAIVSGVLEGNDPVTNIPWQSQMSSVPNVLHQKLDAIKAAVTQIAATGGGTQATVTLSDADRTSIVADLATQLGGAIARLQASQDALTTAVATLAAKVSAAGHSLES